MEIQRGVSQRFKSMSHEEGFRSARPVWQAGRVEKNFAHLSKGTVRIKKRALFDGARGKGKKKKRKKKK